jgi:hypothetical protein
MRTTGADHGFLANHCITLKYPFLLFTPTPFTYTVQVAIGLPDHAPGQVLCGNRSMIDTRPDKHPPGILDRFRRLSRGKKVILIVFLIWFAQAVPKWTAAITADGELAGRIMKVFVTPR